MSRDLRESIRTWLTATAAAAVIAVVIFAVAAGVIAAVSIPMARAKSEAYFRVTGKRVSAWDAFLLDLKVQEPVKRADDAMSRAHYEIVSDTGGVLVIRDTGGGSHMTVTNDAEAVVAELHEAGRLAPGTTLLYYDSDDNLDQILHAGGCFVGFAPGGL